MSIKYLNDAWDMPLNSAEKIVLLAIADCSNNEGFAYPGYKTLLQKTGMARERLSKCIKILKGIGTLEAESHAFIGEGKKVNTYRIKLRSELPISTNLELIEKIKDLRTLYSKPISSHLELRKVRTSNSKSSHLEHEPSVLTTSKEPPSLEKTGESEKVAKFSKPTLQQIANYISEKSYSVDAQVFFSHYQSNGWMVGKNKMKSWKDAITGWNTRKFNEKGNSNGRQHSSSVSNSEWNNAIF